MAINIPKVNPGDLITASFFNSIVDSLESLQAQIDALNGGSSPPSSSPKPVITSVDPSPDVPVGAPMTIHGRNFAVPAVLNTVTVDGLALNDFQSGSDDETIRIGIPSNLSGVPGTKSLVVSTVAGGASDPRSVRFVSSQIVLTGQAVLTNTSGSVGPITAGTPAVFQFLLDATALNASEEFRIQASYSNAVGATAAAWTAGTTYIGASGSEHRVTVSPLTPVTVGVRVVPPAGATSVTLTVQAISVRNHPSSSSAPQIVPLTVGAPPQPADPSMKIVLGTNQRSNVHPNAAGDGLDIKYGSTAVITVEATMTHAGDYRFQGAIDNPDGSIWQILNLPQTILFGPGQGQQVQFKLQLVPTSPPGTGSVTRNFTLTATRQNTDGIGQISNFLAFKIGGFV